MTNKTVLNFDDVCSLVEILVEKMRADNYKPDIIVPLVRGGAVPGIMLSHILGCPVQCVGWATRDYNEQIGNEHNSWLPELAQDGQKILIVDDILDTGKTINDIFADWSTAVPPKSNFQDNVHVACLHERYTSAWAADYVACNIHNDNWVVYPWENLNGRV
jgi:hypoxanthine phosphoribosyltransferase